VSCYFRATYRSKSQNEIHFYLWIRSLDWAQISSIRQTGQDPWTIEVIPPSHGLGCRVRSSLSSCVLARLSRSLCGRRLLMQAARIIMSVDHIRVGGFYVSDKKGLVREITSETGDGDVYWRSYDLRDGSSTGDSLKCSKYRISVWANREATQDEVARLQLGEVPDKYLAWAVGVVDVALRTASDEQLLAEVICRGYNVARQEPHEPARKPKRSKPKRHTE
jgi:hypothetical protein